MAPRKSRNGTATKTSSKNQTTAITWRLICHCKRDRSIDWTVSCANCGKWYHGNCISMNKTLADRIKKLYCRRCNKHYNLTSVFYPKCRLESCERAVVDGSEYCSADHRTEFWKSIALQLHDLPTKNIQILNWLGKRCGSDFSAFSVATPTNLPKPVKPVDQHIRQQLSRLDTAIEYRNNHNICGFDASLLTPDKASNTNEPCQNDIKLCAQHRNWTEMVRTRIELTSLSEDERKEPDPVWVAKRAKYLVAGTTRYSRRKGWRAAYFIPYVWDDNDQDYFLENNPEPFWDKHF